ncbi:MAG: UPF0102 protein [Candidatus Parcubacteria bacterium]|nr:MAG: UPF0102 protein [Candidatus Parcubacteria bacterium]
MLKAKTNLRLKGKIAEDLAAQFIQSKNFKIRERNWVLPNVGEIDIIAEKNGILNFIEVKALWKSKYFQPEYHFNKKKIFKLTKLASFYANRYNFDHWFLSLIAINFDNYKIQIKYYPRLIL